MSKPLYLISGATGATGGHAVRSLVAAGQRVRALVHREDDRSEALVKQGVELVVGDFADFRAIRRAMNGVTGAYFCYPVAPGIVQATAHWSQAAKEAGVEFVINMSQIVARQDARSNASLQHWLSEQVFDWSGIPTVHLRPTFFSEWLLYMAPMIASGTIYASYDEGKAAFISAEDQGRVIASILQNPALHLGRTYPLYGPTEHTFPEIAALTGSVLGRKIAYQRVPFEAMLDGIQSNGPRISRNDSFSGYSETAEKDANGETFLGQHLREASEDYQNGMFAGTNDLVKQITGVAPITIPEFVERHRFVFQSLAEENHA